jgi:hypothetical protein
LFFFNGSVALLIFIFAGRTQEVWQIDAKGLRVPKDAKGCAMIGQHARAQPILLLNIAHVARNNFEY